MTIATRCRQCSSELIMHAEMDEGLCLSCWFGEPTSNACPMVLEAPYGAIWQASAGYDAAAEARQDAESTLQRVPCEGCGAVAVMDDVPRGGYWCGGCQIGEAS